ncbi:MAG: 3-isopropylmalate dehydratase small subunit [Lentisphaeria bacterium]|nr:3-isopropylmalate dehydratase small subunit [Lentisphaeria bacterium]
MSMKIEKIVGPAIPLRGDDIDTDRIIPARFLRCVTFDTLGPHAFEDDRKQDPDHVFNQEKFQNAEVLFAGNNFGCGSSREHAPQSLQKWGIKAVVGLSFAEIFFGNCNAMGIPCAKVTPEDLETLYKVAESDPTVEFTVDVDTLTVSWNGGRVNAEIPAGVRDTFLQGTWNATAVLQQAEGDIQAVANALPYINNFQ